MKLHLFNLFHLGDLFFNRPIVQNIVTSNPSCEVHMYCLYNFAMFQDIPGLTVHLAQSHPKWYILQQNLPFFKIDDDTIAVNLWIATLFTNASSGYTQDQIECQFYNYQIALSNVFRSMMGYMNVSLSLSILNKTELIPTLPPVPMDAFTSWYENHSSSRLVFYYNYNPKSGQPVPFSNHTPILIRLATEYPNTLFLVPSAGPELSSIRNIIDCEKEFGYGPVESGENAIQLSNVADVCDYSIHFDVGACFYYLNRNLYCSKHTVLHVAVHDYYYRNLVSNLPTEDPVRNKIRYIQTKNDSVEPLILAPLGLKRPDFLPKIPSQLLGVPAQ